MTDRMHSMRSSWFIAQPDGVTHAPRAVAWIHPRSVVSLYTLMHHDAHTHTHRQRDTRAVVQAFFLGTIKGVVSRQPSTTHPKCDAARFRRTRAANAPACPTRRRANPRPLRRTCTRQTRGAWPRRRIARGTRPTCAGRRSPARLPRSRPPRRARGRRSTE